MVIDKEVVRLEINLSREVAGVLWGWMARKGVSATEAVRRAIAVWNFVETEVADGNRIVVIGEGHLYEVTLADSEPGKTDLACGRCGG